MGGYNMSYKFSVIIPHYNSFELLVSNLKRIPDDKQIQIIVVDDNSPNRDPLFSALREKFPHVTFLLQSKNKGAGAARNAGIEVAMGKWLLFIDADDYFLPNAFAIFNEFYDSEADIVYFKSESVDLITKEPSNRHIAMCRDIEAYDPGDKKTEEILRYRRYSPLCKMVRRKMVANYHILYDEVRYSNDIMFAVRIGYYAQKIEVSNKAVCCITTSSKSLTRTMTKESLLCRYEVAIRYNHYLDRIGKGSYKATLLRYFLSAFKCVPSAILPMISIGIKMGANLFDGLNDWSKLFDKRTRSLSHF